MDRPGCEGVTVYHGCEGAMVRRCEGSVRRMVRRTLRRLDAPSRTFPPHRALAPSHRRTFAPTISVLALTAALGLSVAASAQEIDGTTPLHWAAHNDDLPQVQRLIKAGAKVNARNDYGATPMSEAAVTGSAALIEALIKAGADVESPNADGQ